MLVKPDCFRALCILMLFVLFTINDVVVIADNEVSTIKDAIDANLRGKTSRAICCKSGCIGSEGRLEGGWCLYDSDCCGYCSWAKCQCDCYTS